MNRLIKISLSATLFLALTLSCSYAKSVTVDIKNRSLRNDTANIPSQCYTKTEDAQSL